MVNFWWHITTLKFVSTKQIFSFSDDEKVQDEIKNFRQTVHDEVLSKKVGNNPPVAELRPEEIPLIATMFADDKVEQSSAEICNEKVPVVHNDDEDEIQPTNYFF